MHTTLYINIYKIMTTSVNYQLIRTRTSVWEMTICCMCIWFLEELSDSIQSWYWYLVFSHLIYMFITYLVLYTVNTATDISRMTQRHTSTVAKHRINDITHVWYRWYDVLPLRPCAHARSSSNNKRLSHGWQCDMIFIKRVVVRYHERARNERVRDITPSRVW